MIALRLRQGVEPTTVKEARIAALLEEARSGLPYSTIGTIGRHRHSVEQAALEHLLVGRLLGGGYLELRVEDARGDEIAALVPSTPAFALVGGGEPDRPWALSRFAHLRREAGHWVLQDPRLCAIVRLSARGLRCLAELSDGPPGSSGDETSVVELARLLAQAGFLRPPLAPGDASGVHPEWEVHDLAFHLATRRGRHGRPTGATYHLRERLAPLPPLKPTTGGAVIALHRPDLEAAIASDPSFARVVESRRSVREYGPQPLTVEQVGALLFRTVRLKALRPGDHDEVSSRPYPSAGARYPLETYLAVGQCRGLPPGLYHYDPRGHALAPTAGDAEAVAALLREGTVGSRPPSVLIVLAARIARVSWKYQSIAYSLVLKDAGVLMGAIDLTATALGFGACCVGSGDSELFARAAATDPLLEPSVAEIALGSSNQG